MRSKRRSFSLACRLLSALLLASCALGASAVSEGEYCETDGSSCSDLGEVALCNHNSWTVVGCPTGTLCRITDENVAVCDHPKKKSNGPKTDSKTTNHGLKIGTETKDGTETEHQSIFETFSTNSEDIDYEVMAKLAREAAKAGGYKLGGYFADLNAVQGYGGNPTPYPAEVYGGVWDESYAKHADEDLTVGKVQVASPSADFSQESFDKLPVVHLTNNFVKPQTHRPTPAGRNEIESPQNLFQEEGHKNLVPQGESSFRGGLPAENYQDLSDGRGPAVELSQFSTGNEASHAWPVEAQAELTETRVGPANNAEPPGHLVIPPARNEPPQQPLQPANSYSLHFNTPHTTPNSILVPVTVALDPFNHIAQGGPAPIFAEDKSPSIRAEVEENTNRVTVENGRILNFRKNNHIPKPTTGFRSLFASPNTHPAINMQHLPHSPLEIPPPRNRIDEPQPQAANQIRGDFGNHESLQAANQIRGGLGNLGNSQAASQIRGGLGNLVHPQATNKIRGSLGNHMSPQVANQILAGSHGNSPTTERTIHVGDNHVQIGSVPSMDLIDPVGTHIRGESVLPETQVDRFLKTTGSKYPPGSKEALVAFLNNLGYEEASEKEANPVQIGHNYNLVKTPDVPTKHENLRGLSSDIQLGTNQASISGQQISPEFGSEEPFPRVASEFWPGAELGEEQEAGSWANIHQVSGSSQIIKPNPGEAPFLPPDQEFPPRGSDVLVSLEEFRRVLTECGYPSPTEEQYVICMKHIGKTASMRSRREFAMFMAQVLWESDGLRSKEELACQESKCPDQYKTDQDFPGRTYYGRGYIKLSWHYNYLAASEALYGDNRLARHPELVSMDEEIAWAVACWYWRAHVHEAPGVQEGQFGATTNAINGELECRGIQQRKARKRFELYRKILVALRIPEEPNEHGCYN